jgi:SAM-dependent methyltransferase
MMSSPDIIGDALKSFHYHKDSTPLIVNTNYGDAEEMLPQSLYREKDAIPDYEWVMVDQARGKTLDIGAGCGSHSLLLQEKVLEVVAVEISSGAAEIARLRGVINIKNEDFKNYQHEKFDTITMVMNGIGVVGSLKGFTDSLQKFKTMLNPGGQLLFDTTDISYLGRKTTSSEYFGEVSFQFEYKGSKGAWFNWLYLDITTLRSVCNSHGWKMQIIYQDEEDHFVMKLQPV